MTNRQESNLAQFQALLVKTILGSAAAEKLSQGRLPNQLLQPYVTELTTLSEQYVSGDKFAPSISELAAAGYALYYAPINYAKMESLLQAIKGRLNKCPLRILDFGCGPATAGAVALDTLSNIAELHLVERSKQMLTLASNIIGSKLKTPVRVTKDANLSADHTELDLIICANVLNELSPQQRETLLTELVARLNEDGVLLILEPALKQDTRDLMNTRDQLLKDHPDLSAIYPCTHSHPCPMLAESKEDWCHRSLTWQRPGIVEQFDQLTGFNKHRIKFTALALQKHARSQPTLPGHYRILTTPESGRTGISTVLCGPASSGSASSGPATSSPTGSIEGALLDLRIAKKDLTDENRLLRRADQWDQLILINRTPEKNKPLNLSSNDQIELPGNQ